MSRKKIVEINFVLTKKNLRNCFLFSKNYEKPTLESDILAERLNFLLSQFCF